jgi:hypothetical protein
MQNIWPAADLLSRNSHCSYNQLHKCTETIIIVIIVVVVVVLVLVVGILQAVVRDISLFHGESILPM